MAPPETVEFGRLSRPASDVPSIAALLVPLLQHWKAVTGVPLAVGFVVAVISTFAHPTYTATTTFTAEVGNASALPTNLADIAGRFGLPSGRAGASQPDFFAEVLTSQEILIAVLQTPFSDDRASPPVQRELLDILRIEGALSGERLGRGVRKLRAMVHASFSTRTDIVTVNVDAPTARLAADMANRMVQLLDSFNIVRRQYQSRELRRFAGERLAEARQELSAAEDRSLRFLQVNRSFRDSPLLLFEAKRLEREVDLRQEIVVTLAREYEEARIAEHRDVPLLSIIDPARPPDKKSSPRRLLNTLIAFFVTGVIIILVTYGRAMWAREAGEDLASHQHLAQSWNAFLAEIKHKLRGKRAGAG